MWDPTVMVGFDTETTGVDVNTSRIVTACIIKVHGSETQQLDWLADPGVEIPEVATRVHGVTTSFAQSHGRPAPDVADEVATHLVEAMTAGIPVVAFNAAYDFTLLEYELMRYGLPTLRERLGGEPFPVLDPLVLDRFLYRYRRGKRRLSDLCAHYGVKVDLAFHQADADVLATLRLMHRMITSTAALRSTSLAKLHDLQKTSHQAWAQNFSEYLLTQGKVETIDGGWPLSHRLTASELRAGVREPERFEREPHEGTEH